MTDESLSFARRADMPWLRFASLPSLNGAPAWLTGTAHRCAALAISRISHRVRHRISRRLRSRAYLNARPRLTMQTDGLPPDQRPRRRIRR